MSGRWYSLRRLARMFGRSQSGNVALMFGIAFVPMTLAIGVSVDYGRAITVRDKLNNAADIATLGSISKTANPFVTTPTPTGVRKYFDQTATALTGVTITDFQATITPSITTMTVAVNYTASVPMAFGALFGKPTVAVSGTSTAVANAPPYVNFYLLLDNSPSMGLGATDTDISHLQSLTPDSCAFACHQHSFDSSGHITGDNMSDYYHVAKNNGVTTRIDVLRTATQQLTQSATATATMPNQFQMAVYTFSDTFQTVAPLSANMTTVSSNASAIDLAYAYYNQRDTQTSFDTAMSYINSAMPDPGTGYSGSNQPQEFLFLVTDGVEDEPVGSGSGSGDPADTPTSYQALNTLPNLSNSNAGNVNSKRLITTLNTSLCTTIKNRGIKIAVLYTPYLPVTNNAFYNQWVAPISSSIPTNLQNCASQGFYFQITPTQGISAAMQAMFQAAVSSVMLTH